MEERLPVKKANTDSPELFAGDKVPSTPKERLIVFGSRLSGAENFGKAANDYLELHRIDGSMVHWTRNARFIEDVFYGRNSDLPDVNEGTPLAVVVFPEMRFYDDIGGSTIDTPVEFIRELCEKNGVPIVEFVNINSSQELEQGLGALVTRLKAKLELPPTS